MGINQKGYGYQSKNFNGLFWHATLVNLYSQGATETVNVWKAVQYEDEFAEFANDPEASISVSLSSSLQISADAKVSGGIQTGFLSADLQGSVGTISTVSANDQAGGTKPFVAAFATGYTWKVQDTSGNTITYVQSFNDQNDPLSTLSTTDYLTESQVLQSGGYKLVNVASDTYTGSKITFSGSYTASASVSMSAFGNSLSTEVAEQSGNSQSVDYVITNNNNYDECFLLYQVGMEVHIWLYHTGAC